MKSFLTSKTIWFGVLQIVFGGVGMLAGFLSQEAGMSLVVTGFGTIGLRLKTTTAIQ